VQPLVLYLPYGVEKLKEYRREFPLLRMCATHAPVSETMAERKPFLSEEIAAHQGIWHKVYIFKVVCVKR
jgi:hypothetical protein